MIRASLYGRLGQDPQPLTTKTGKPMTAPRLPWTCPASTPIQSGRGASASVRAAYDRRSTAKLYPTCTVTGAIAIGPSPVMHYGST